MRGIPGMEVFCPADEDDLVKMLPAIWQSDSPSYVRINHRKGNYNHSSFQQNKAEIISIGEDVTILVYGFLFENGLATKMLLEKQGLSTGLINMRTLKPADEAAIISAALNSKMTVTLEDHLLSGGLYTITAEVLLKNRISANVFPISLKESWFKPGLLSEVLEYESFTAEKMCFKILEEFNKTKTNIHA